MLYYYTILIKGDFSMKKILALVLCLFMFTAFVACSSKTNNDDETQKPTQSTEQTLPSDNETQTPDSEDEEKNDIVDSKSDNIKECLEYKGYFYDIELSGWNDGVYDVLIVGEDKDFIFYQKAKKENNVYGAIGKKYITSIEKGCIEVSYQAIAVDEEGYPMIPDNSSFTRAVQAYIKKEWFTILFDQTKISQQAFQQAQQDYAWAVGDCRSEFNRLTIDKAESLFNSWRTLIIRDSEHRRGFKNNGSKEYIKTH